MSFELSKQINFAQPIFQFLPTEINAGGFAALPLHGGIFSDLKHVWHARGPCIEVRHIPTGKKVGTWIFGGTPKTDKNDQTTNICFVEEIKSENGRMPLLIVALEIRDREEVYIGSLICVLDIFSSRVLRAIKLKDKITCIHVVDSGNDLSIIPEPSPFRYFDGIVAVGTHQGNVYLVDICRQICEDALDNPEISIFRDESNPCKMVILPHEKLKNIKKYIERSMENGEHIAVHINVVPEYIEDRFILKGEKGEDRMHVSINEVEVSALHYSFQIASLMVGYNFGAYQLWDLRYASLVYTSPVCEDLLPITNFALQEPVDDPKAYCYIWVSYSRNLLYTSGVPYAVMYSFYFDNKKSFGSFGNLYENFQHCSVRLQIELGTANLPGLNARVKGGSCIGLQSISKNLPSSSLALCLVSWLVWDSSRNLQTCALLFDLNQWYKEQMPNTPDWSNCSNYIIKNGINSLLLDVKLDKKSIGQFVGVQKLEEHFCPTSLSFDIIGISDTGILNIHNKSLQKVLIDRLEEDGHLALCRPGDYYEQIISLGLIPIFCDTPVNVSSDVDFQRELLLNMILEQKLIHWFCKCALKLSNDAFKSQGLPLTSLLGWAFQRAIQLKTSCDQFCTCLFDYSGVRLDTNTIALINNSTSQIKNICSVYNYVSNRLLSFICDKEIFLEEQRCLENVTVYYEVLLWMVNIGLLPEGNNLHEMGDMLVAPYEVEELSKYYIGKRTRLQEVSHQTFVEKDCLLFIDNLINNQSATSVVRQNWQEDGGSGLYPPPSLQSALRIYLLDGADLIFKHSIMTYTLLDIAVTLDEKEKMNVIKMLLKFPQIFDLSQSRIKIVQAFWHLDHDDYQTALDYILDPSVLSDDLEQWHHSVMMRSLLIQEQFTLALLYLQIRKPSISDDKDLLTVLSLLISKNMLDEAFKFHHSHQSKNGEGLLMHIFNECNRNEQLHSLLFRCLDTDEERGLFKYLQSIKSPRTEDLKIFYYLLRSRFLEAFDSYSNCKIRNPQTQGLMGQSGATTADNVVKLFKSLMPDVNKNLVELVRKEKSNLWKEVNRPTPLSVFAHNIKEKVSYKSDLIFATLSKAKRTFNDSDYDNLLKDVHTENTPFLRTPGGLKNGVKVTTPLLNCTIIEQNQDDEYGPSPRKKLKLSPRISTTSPNKPFSNLSVNKSLSKITTPIVKRKLSMDKSILSTSSRLPHSILKGSKTFNESLANDKSLNNLSLEGSRFTLRPRKAMTPSKVKFDDLRYSTSSNEQSSPKVSDHSTRESESDSKEETFYSPVPSPCKKTEDSQETHKERCKTPECLDDIEDTEETRAQQVQNIEIEKIVTDYSKHRMVYQSPRSRRSYKRSLGESPIPVRSSPRLSQKFEKEKSPDNTQDPEPLLEESQPAKPSPSVAVQKIRGRRSLARAVLEHNTFSKTHISTYVEKSVINVSADSTLSEYSLKDSSLSIVSDIYVNSPSPDHSILELINQCKNSDSRDSSINDDDDDVADYSSPSFIQQREDEGAKEMITSKVVTTVKESVLAEKVEMRTERVLDEDMGDREASRISEPVIQVPKEDISLQQIKADTVEESDPNNSKAETTIDECKQIAISVHNDDGYQMDVDDESGLISTLYDDLSSGSEDLREILNKNNTENEPAKLVEDHKYEVKNTGGNEKFYPDQRDLDQGVKTDVIEIESSDDDAQKPDPNVEHNEDNSSNSSLDLNKDGYSPESSAILEFSSSSNISSSSEDLGKTGDKSNHSHKSDKSSTSEDLIDNFERNIYQEESSPNSDETVDIHGKKREQSVNSNEDSRSNDSQNTEKVLNSDAGDVDRETDSDSSKSSRITSEVQKVLDDQSQNKKVESEETNTTDHNDALMLAEEANTTDHNDASKIATHTKPMPENITELKKVEENESTEEIMVQDVTTVSFVNEKVSVQEQVLEEMPADCEQMNTLQLDESIINTESKSGDKTSKALQCTLQLHEELTFDEKKGHLHSDVATKSLQCTLKFVEQSTFEENNDTLVDNYQKDATKSSQGSVNCNEKCLSPIKEVTVDRKLNLSEKCDKEIIVQCTFKDSEGPTSTISETNMDDSVICTPVVLKSTATKTYSKMETKERELNKTPKLKPVERTYLRRDRLTSQSSAFSGNETEDPSRETFNFTNKPADTIERKTSEEITSTENLSDADNKKYIKETKEANEAQRDLSKDTTSSAEQSTLLDIEKTEKPRRITRRMSANFESSQTSDSPTPQKLAQKILKADEVERSSTPETPKSKRRSLKPKTPLPLSNTEKTNIDQSTVDNYKTPKTKYDLEKLKPLKRLRSASVDQPQVIRTYSRKTRNKSIDELAQDVTREIEKNHEKLVRTMLEPISVIPETKGGKGKAKSDLGTYTTKRRLTRTQASMLKKDILPSVEEMDPINLLDKPPFQGDPDPDESKVYEGSSPSSGTPSISASQRSRKRSTSVISDVPSIKPPSVSSRASTTAGIKSRLRSASKDTNSDVSDSPSPSKKSKKPEVTETPDTVQKRQRGRPRTLSVSSNVSNTSNISNKTNASTRSTRGRKTSTKKELPEIEEEKNSEVDLETPVTARRGRPRKKN